MKPTYENNSDVVYHFLLLYPSHAVMSHVLELVESSTNLYLNTMLNKSNHTIGGVRGEASVALESIDASINPNQSPHSDKACEKFGEEEECISIEVQVTISFQKTITENDVRYELLQHSNTLASISSNGLIELFYIGAVPVITETTFSLKGGEVSTMENDAIAYFETCVEVFLNGMFTLSSVTIFSVRVEKQYYRDEKQEAIRSHTRQEQNRYGARLSTLSPLRIVTTITGEYTPPPVLDFGLVIDEIFEESGEYFLETIKEKTTLKNWNEITTNSISPQSLSRLAGISNNKAPANIFVVKQFSIPLYLILTAFVLVGIAFVFRERTKIKSNVKVIGMKELMDRNNAQDLSTKNKSFRKFLGKKTLSNSSGLTLRSEERIYSMRNLDCNENFNENENETEACVKQESEKQNNLLKT